MLLPAIMLVVAGCTSSPSSSSEGRVIVGAGTTLVDSQFIAEIVSAYGEVDPSNAISVVGLSSSEAIALATSGDADVIITHNREALDQFLTEHPQSIRSDVFASIFFVVADPTIAISAGSIDEAFTEIASRGIQFISRDDGSGTHAAELAIWERIRFDPVGESWYTRTGTGMGATLQVTDQRHAATLAEHGAFLASASALSLERVADTDFPNPYDLTVVDPSNSRAAAEFAAWITSPDGIEAIERANTKLFGMQVYSAPVHALP
jgi:tungstate transport system substrate-binding protein